jgi:hypothetical protein
MAYADALSVEFANAADERLEREFVSAQAAEIVEARLQNRARRFNRVVSATFKRVMSVLRQGASLVYRDNYTYHVHPQPPHNNTRKPPAASSDAHPPPCTWYV